MDHGNEYKHVVTHKKPYNQRSRKIGYFPDFRSIIHQTLGQEQEEESAVYQSFTSSEDLIVIPVK